jgi:hypothetical protein
MHQWAHRMKVEFEAGDDSEVAATAANCPKQVRVLTFRCLKHLAIGGDDFRRDQVVNG